MIKFCAFCFPTIYLRAKYRFFSVLTLQMLELWLNKTPMDDDLLDFIMTHCIDTVETLSLQECKITNKVVAELTEQIKKRKEPVKYCNVDLHL